MFPVIYVIYGVLTGASPLQAIADRKTLVISNTKHSANHSGHGLVPSFLFDSKVKISLS